MTIPQCVQDCIDAYPVCGAAIQAAYELGVADGRLEQIQQRVAECEAKMEKMERMMDDGQYE